MGSSDAIGLIELIGLPTAIACADAAVKAANIRLLGYESSTAGLITVKISGNVGAVQAAVAAGVAASRKVGRIAGEIIIARPHQDLDKLILSEDTVKAFEAKDESEENSSVNSQFETEEIVVNRGIEESMEIEEIEYLDRSESDSDIAVDSDNNTDKLTEDNPQSAGATCNICKDPDCSRKKGEPRSTCIHFNDK